MCYTILAAQLHLKPVGPKRLGIPWGGVAGPGTSSQHILVLAQRPATPAFTSPLKELWKTILVLSLARLSASLATPRAAFHPYQATQRT